MLFASEITASIHQSVHAKVAAHCPHAGTHTKQIMLMIVARPIGNVPIDLLSAMLWNLSVEKIGIQTEKQRLRRMVQHCCPDTSKESISSQRNKAEQGEQEHIKSENNHWDPIYPSAIIRKVVKKNRNNTCSHGSTELEKGEKMRLR